MKASKPKNLAASVRARLMNVSKASGEDFGYVLTRYGLERLLARLGQSEHREAFTLKGAMLFRLWSPTLHRPTKDVDLLGTGAPDVARLDGVFRELCVVVMDDDDGVTFDPKSVHAARMKEDAEYEGIRVNLTARIGSARLELQVDVGFGDAVTPAATTVEFPTLLGGLAPKLRVYPRESVVAEKLEAMVHLGVANSRMKDFFDIWFLAQTFAFDGAVLSAAIRATFERRGTPLPIDAPLALTPAFATDATKLTQWKAFMARGKLAPADLTLEQAVSSIASFLSPLLEAARGGHLFDAAWAPNGPRWDESMSRSPRTLQREEVSRSEGNPSPNASRPTR